MPNTNAVSEQRLPILMVVVGRQRVGKTTVVNTIIQRVREAGGQMQIWNADNNNTSYNLGMFYDDVLSPSSTIPGDIRTWMEERLADQILHRFDAMLDVGGGDTPFTKLIQEIPFIDELEAEGIRVVVVHVVGPEQADVDYLQAFAKADILQSKATLIFFNTGLVMGDSTIKSAFAPIENHPAIVEAIHAGAQVVIFPRLGCMSEVTNRALTFREATTALEKGGHSSMARFDRTRVRMWFDKAVPEALEDVPPLWLPATRRPETEDAAGVPSDLGLGPK